MPSIESLYPTQAVELPYSKAVIQVKTKFSAHENSVINKEEGNEARANRMILFAIKDWDFTGADDQKLPVNEDTIGLIPASDLDYLMGEFSKLLRDANKDVLAEAEKEEATPAASEDVETPEEEIMPEVPRQETQVNAGPTPQPSRR